MVCTQQVLWRASSYMEVDEAMGGAMQKGVKCDLEMLKLCTPVLRMCDGIFTKWSVDRSSQSMYELQHPFTRRVCPGIRNCTEKARSTN